MKTKLLFSVFLLFVMIQNAQSQWTYSNLSEPKYNMGSTALGNKAYFAGGSDLIKYMDKVEVYDVSTGTWEVAGKLSKPRQIIGGVVSCGSKIFFAGGGFDEGVSYDIVDIYDTLTKEWSVAHLSVDRFSLGAISHGDTVMFAGGVQAINNSPVFKNTVDIYNSKTGEWTVDQLSIARMGVAATVVGDLAFFAGGLNIIGNDVNTTARVDIYNFATKTWSQDSLSQARAFSMSVTVGSKVIIAGGCTEINKSTNRVDIYDASTGKWTTATLSVARAGIGAAVVAGKAFFVGGGNFMGGGFNMPSDVIDIYDPVNNTWSMDFLSQPVESHSVVGVGNHLIVAGGQTVGEVCLKKVETISTGITSNQLEDSFLKVYPNPVSEKITVEFSGWQIIDGTVTIYGIAGQQLMSQKLIGLKSEIAVNNLPVGLYFIKLVSTNKTGIGKFVKN